MPKVVYRYSLKWDLIWAYRTIKNGKWLKSEKLVVFKPSLFKMMKLWFNRSENLEIEAEFPVTCYWTSSGTWGSYIPPDKIFVCPRGLKNIEKVIRNEISHLKYESAVEKMTHREKEEYINSKL